MGIPNVKASEILNKITKAKRSQGDLYRYVNTKDAKISARLTGCGTWLHLREWIQSGESRLVHANFCKSHFLCQACAIRRAGRMTESYAKKVKTVMEGEKGLIPAMVTLTVKNGHDLAERIAHLKASMSRMVAARRKFISSSSRNVHVEWAKVAGSVVAFEVTMGKTEGWHPHLHAFVLLRQYIDQPLFSAEWERFTGDSKIVGVTKCHNGIVAGLIETLKYSVKFSELTPAQIWEVHTTCKGSRSINPSGVLRGVPWPDIDEDDMEGLEGPYRDFMASWLWSEGRYMITRREDMAEILASIERPQLERKLSAMGMADRDSNVTINPNTVTK